MASPSSTVPDGAFPPVRADMTVWWPVLLGVLSLFLPTYLWLANGMWNTEEQSHGPIVLAIALWMLWQKRDILFAGEDMARPASGGLLLLTGLALYVIGRSQGVPLFEAGSQVPILAGTVLLLRGGATLRLLWFPLFFLLFMVPLPGFILDMLTGPLKQLVSVIVEQALYLLDYPISRNGVVLSIGPYRLLVADACSGLHSMYSLSAMGMLYLYLMRRPGRWRNGLLALCILPIAFFTNVMRVVVLVLVTYYLGDEAGQGIFHGFASIALFAFALMLLFALDVFLGLFFGQREGKAS